MAGVKEHFKGALSVAIGYDAPSVPARNSPRLHRERETRQEDADHRRDGGGKRLRRRAHQSGRRITLAPGPPSQLLGGMQGPLSGLVGTLTASKFCWSIDRD